MWLSLFAVAAGLAVSFALGAVLLESLARESHEERATY